MTREQAVEMVARALRESDYEGGHCDDVCTWASYVDGARAVITALQSAGVLRLEE